MKTLVKILLAFSLIQFSCSNDPPPTPMEEVLPIGTHKIPESVQITTGNAAEGRDYLIYGGYIGSGVPYDIFVNVFSGDGNKLGRTGDNEAIPHDFNAFTDESGIKLVGGITCMGCHASEINGEFILGLGNSFSDFTSDQSTGIEILRGFVESFYGLASPEYQAFEPYYKGSAAVAPYSITKSMGLNPAFRIEEAAIAHRNPVDLTWSDDPLYTVPDVGYHSDVPPLWNVDRKNALYYNGMGRGEFTRLL